MLGVLAVVLACATVALALVAGVGLTEQGQSGRPLMSLFAAVLVLSTAAIAVVVARTVLEKPVRPGNDRGRGDLRAHAHPGPQPRTRSARRTR